MHWIFGLLLVIALSLGPPNTEQGHVGQIDISTGTGGTKIDMTIETSGNPKVGLEFSTHQSED